MTVFEVVSQGITAACNIFAVVCCVYILFNLRKNDKDD